jgi:hypothetical protein
MIEDGRGRTKIQLEREWCIEKVMGEGYSRAEAEERCKIGRTGDTHVPGVRVAHDAEDPGFMACVEWRMGEGDSREEAEKYCRENQEENKRYTGPASDSSLGIVNREATPLERCMSCRMDIYGEDEETARRTCTRMFNDPMFIHAFQQGDAWQMGAAFYRWDYDHSPFYKSFRERDRQERKSMDRHVAEIIKEIRSDTKDPDRFLPDVCLKERAERIYEERKEGKQVKAMKKARQDRSTVGSLYGKTKEQIIREGTEDTKQVGTDIYRTDTPLKRSKSKTTVGNLYGKTRKQILEENEE